MSCNTTLSGIARLFISEITGDTFTYYIPSGNSEQIIIPTNRQFTELEIDDGASFKQSRKIDKFGTSYEKEIKFTFYDFATTFDYEKLALLFQTYDDVWWIAGYDVGFTLGKKDGETGANDQGDSINEVTLESKSFNKVKQIVPGIITGATGGGIEFPPIPSGTTEPAPILSYYYGKVNSSNAIAGANRPSANESLVLNGTEVNQPSTGTIGITFSSSSDQYVWFAIPNASTSKTVWYVDVYNSGSIGGAISVGGNLFPNPEIVSVGGNNYKVYIANWQSEITAIEFRNS
jgi:hypothetical protein